jgi:transketolase
MSASQNDLDQLCINTIRMLSADAVQAANSGHPGAPMGLAPLAYVLWTKFLKHDPADPKWPDRDRFVLSNGHASMLLYSLLHLCGYDLSLDEIKRFRQWGSRTPGHPEYGHAPGVETTTGPLGQGFGNAVGMAIAEAVLSSRFNRPGHEIVDHFTYVLAGDGDMMEGVASEAASLAGHLKLGKLIAFYDDNHITIEGNTELAFSESVEARFNGYGWRVLRAAGDGNDLEAIAEAIRAARSQSERPTLIIVRTHIGFGSPNRQDTAKAHGEALGAEEVKLTKQNLGWPAEPAFLIPDEVRAVFGRTLERGRESESEWKKRWAAYEAKHPDLAAEWKRAMSRALPDGWDAPIRNYRPKDAVATRQASGEVLNAVAPLLPTLIGGSADLAPSNNTLLKGSGDFSAKDHSGRNMHFGVREHAMGAVLNGMTVHGGLIPYGATFLVFSDYMRPSIRLAALMNLPVIYVFTHDSVGLGEDGPTHQPVEHLAALRAIPNLTVIRPADAAETAWAWHVAIENSGGPVALILTRQKVPNLDRGPFASAEDLRLGAYVVSESPEERIDLILIATGSEVHVAVEAQKRLHAEGIGARVVSMPSWELFDRQPEDYRESVLPKGVPVRLAVEAASTMGWHRYVGPAGDVVGIDRFGASAPGPVVLKEFGFTAEQVAARAGDLLKKLSA